MTARWLPSTVQPAAQNELPSQRELSRQVNPMPYQTVTFEDGTTEEYDTEALSAGAEGEIFRSRSGKHLVKLYFSRPGYDAERMQRIKTLINDVNPTKNAPYWEEYFSWPEKLVIRPRIGFRMRFAQGLRTVDNFFFRTYYERVLKPDERGWFIGRVAAAIKIVNAANRLSSSGLCYPDFSDKNIMVDAYDGRMTLIDCDSITVPGRISPTVQGTSWYRAPELVKGSLTIPNVRSDRHALAVILYLWLLRWHPLNGDKVHDSRDPDRDEELRLGERALYIEHPTDRSNRAQGQPYSARILGNEMSELFRRAFVEGLFDPGRRPQPAEWQEALWHLYDRVIPCPTPSCDWHSYVAAPTRGLACPCCNQRIKQPTNLPFLYLMRHKGSSNADDFQMDLMRAHYVVGWPERTLNAWHFKPNASSLPPAPDQMPDIAAKAAFDYDPHKDQWYITNLALPEARSSGPGGSAGVWRTWPVNSSLPLVNGMLLQGGPGTEYFRIKVHIAQVA